MTGCSPRLKTYTLSLASTPTAPTSLNDHPSGSFAQFSMMRYLKSPLPTIIAMPGPVFCRGESIEATGAKQAHQERDVEELPRLLVIASLAQGGRSDQV